MVTLCSQSQATHNPSHVKAFEEEAANEWFVFCVDNDEALIMCRVAVVRCLKVGKISLGYGFVVKVGFATMERCPMKVRGGVVFWGAIEKQNGGSNMRLCLMKKQ